MQILKILLISITLIFNNISFAEKIPHAQPSLAPMIEKVMPSVVAISGFKKIKASPFSPESHVEKNEHIFRQIGSGVVVDSDKGYILTNAHVVYDLDEIYVSLTDNRRFKAELVGSDKSSDVALIKIDADKLTPIRFGNSDKLKVGDFVVAIGCPFGFSHTVTSGIVSAIGRNESDIGLDDGYFQLIQTDAAINMGNSGGALINLDGELVGINTAIISPPTSGGNVGVGLSIPANIAKSIMGQLSNDGQVHRGPLGVMVQLITPELAEGFGLKQTDGAIITDIIPNTPADAAKLEVGDVIMKVDNTAIKDPSHLRTMISLIPIGNKTKLTLIRGGKTITQFATIMNPDDKLIKGETIFEGLDGALLEETQNDFPMKGFVVSKINKNSKVTRSDLREGDVIVGANHRVIDSLTTLKKQAEKNKNVLVLQVSRKKNAFFVAVKST